MSSLFTTRGGSRIYNLQSFAAAARKAAQGMREPVEMAVLLIYVKCDPPTGRFAELMGMKASDLTERLKSAGQRLVSDEAFREEFHRLNAYFGRQEDDQKTDPLLGRALASGWGKPNEKKKPAAAEDTTSTATAGA